MSTVSVGGDQSPKSYPSEPQTEAVPIGYASDAGDGGPRLYRNYSRGHSHSQSAHSPGGQITQWSSWRTPRQRDPGAQPLTINLTFGGANGPSQSLTINHDHHQREPAGVPWTDEVERRRLNQPSLRNPREGKNDLMVNLFQQPDLPPFPYEQLGGYMNEKGYYPDEKSRDAFPAMPSKPSYQHAMADIPLSQLPVHEPPAPPTEWIIPPVESGFLKMVQNFDFKWWGSTMGTGIVAILFFNFSTIYTDAAGILRPLSVIFYIGNVVLFGILLLMTILRYLLYPKLFVMMVSDPGQAMYLGTFPMGFATIVTMTVNIAVPDFGDAWIEIAWAFWWVDVVVSMATALIIPWLLQVRHHGITDLDKMTAGWLLPIVAPIVAAATGSVVASVLDPDRALVTILTCYAILGTGLSAALAIIVIYFLRIATKKLPPIEHMVSVFLPLGPLGQGGFAAQKLGEQALRVFPLTNTLPSARDAGEILYVIGFVVAITLWGFGLMWLFFALLSIATSTPRIPFSLGWWAFTFPLGVFAVSTLTMGVNLPSATFQVLGTIFGSAVIVLWVMVAVMLVSRLVGGKKYTIFKAPEVMGAHNKRQA